MAAVLALVDHSSYAVSVCDHAVWAARRLDWPVTLLHVAPAAEGEAPSGVEADPAALLETAAARVSQGGGSKVATLLGLGDPVTAFAAEAAAAGLAVIGKRGEGADFVTGRLGAHLEPLMRASPVPILVASRAFRPIARVLMAFDGSEPVQRAIPWLASHPLCADTAITLLSVGALNAAARAAREVALATLAAAGHTPAAVEAEGHPAAAIAEFVETGPADLLVMGVARPSRLRSLVLGNTTTEALQACRVPVLLFR